MKNLRLLRRLVQIAFLLFFYWLLINTTYPVGGFVPVDLFLKVSPLNGIMSAIAGKSFYPGFWICLIIVALTIVIGRFFCGWVCPFGTTIDITDRLLRKIRKKYSPTKRNIHHGKYYILIILLITAIFGLNIAGWFDPISMSTRVYGLTLHPYGYFLVDNLVGQVHSWQPDGIIDKVLGGIERFVFHPQVQVGKFSQPFFQYHLVIAIIFLGIVLFGLWKRRFYCRVLCPLGALLTIAGRVSIFRRYVSDKCTECLECVENCKMGAIGGKGKGNFRGECIECLDCEVVCPADAITFNPWKVRKQKVDIQSKFLPVNFTRRETIAAIIGSFAVLPLFKLNLFTQRKRISQDMNVGEPSSFTIRPPGPIDEKEFLAKCIRCGECMKVCPTNGLHPLLFQEGLEGFWTPILVSRIGYCEFTCTTCMEVCPTKALPLLSVEEKKKFVIGKARIDRNKCIPWRALAEWDEKTEWSDTFNCKVCEEHCPAEDEIDKGKAIRLKPYKVQTREGERCIDRVYIVDRICIGCGICEKVCPVEGESAIRVYRTDERGVVEPKEPKGG